MARIALIGAGSVVFAKKLIGDLLQFPALAEVEIALMDIDPARLRAAEILTQRMIAKLRVPARVVATLDRTKAIRGAHYVICTIQVGGYRPGTVLDFEIPAKYGLRQTIGDTLGVGGVFRALRTIPRLLEIARDIADVGAPGCMLLNYTNPMAMNCWAVARTTGIPHLGLCHSVQGTSRQLAAYAGLPYEDVRYLVAGINHMAFFLRFEYRGQDAYPLLFKALEDPARTTELVRFEMMRRLGYFVTESSEHQAEYTPYFIHHGPSMIDRFRIPIDEYRRRSEAIIARWHEVERKVMGEEGEVEIEPQSFEYGARIVHARETHTPAVVYGNLPNTGLIPQLPSGCCVEVPVLIDGAGIQPTHISELPPQLAAIIRTHVNVQELAVEAALTGRREHIYHAVMLDPHTSATLPLDRIWEMSDELLAAHQREGLLGEFTPVVRNTGRAARGIVDRLVAQLRLAGPLGVAEGEETSLEVELENPLPVGVAVMLTLSLPADALESAGTTSATLEVPGNGRARTSLVVRAKAPLVRPTRIGLKADRADVLCRGLSVEPRKTLRADSAGEACFALMLAGLPAVTGAWRDDGENLLFRVRVEDSATVEHQSGRSLLDRSGLRCFISPRPGAAIAQVFLQPDTTDGVVRICFEDGRVVPDAGGCVTKTELSYEMTGHLPKLAVGLAPDATTFLLQIHAYLGALGDAHSGGLAQLVEQFAPWSRDENFASICL